MRQCQMTLVLEGVIGAECLNGELQIQNGQAHRDSPGGTGMSLILSMEILDEG